jgi:capsular exopolysaccharide synthesis family protein
MVANGSHEGQPVTLGGLLSAVWRRKWLIALITIGLTFMNLAVAVLLPKVYRAEALLQMDPRAGRTIDGNITVTALAADMDGGGLGAQAEVIRSPAVALRAIEAARLLDTPEYRRVQEGSGKSQAPWSRAADWFRTTLLGQEPAVTAAEEVAAVSRRREDRVLRHFNENLQVNYDLRGGSLRIGSLSGDPVLAAATANATADAFVGQQLDRKLELLRNTGQWLDDRVGTLRARASEAEEKLAEFRQRHKLGTSQSPTFTQQQIGDLTNQLVAAISEEAETVARMRAAELAASSRRLGDLPQAVISETIRALREQEALLSRRIAELNSGGNLRTAADVRAELSEIRRYIAEEQDRILNSIRQQAAISTARRTGLETAIERLKREADERQGHAVQAELLEREAVANRAVLDASIRRSEEIRTLSGLLRPDLTIVSRARVPGQPSKPNVALVGAIGLVGSFIVGLGAALALEARKVTIRSLAQGEGALGVVGIGWLPTVRLRRRQAVHDVVVDEPDHLYSECLRSVAVALRTGDRHSSRVVLVTSATPGEGKTSFAISYGRTITSAGRTCLLIDADLRRPAIGARLQGGQHKGLAEAIGARATLPDVVQTDPASGLDFIATGEGGLDPLWALDNSTFAELLEQAREHYDTIIIDAPPVLAVSDSAVLAQRADAVVVIVAWSRTPVRVAARALARLQRAGATTVGFVLSQVEVGSLPRGEDERMAIDYSYGKSALRYRPARRIDQNKLLPAGGGTAR